MAYEQNKKTKKMLNANKLRENDKLRLITVELSHSIETI